MPSRRAVIAACGSAVLAGCTAVRDDPTATGDWAQRGYDSSRTGRSNVDGPNAPLTTAWTYEGDADRHGPDVSPVVADGTVYLAYTREHEDERAAVVDAVDAATGDRRWSATAATTAESIHETDVYADSLAIVDDAVVLQTATGLVALEADDGAERWWFDNVGEGQLGTVPVQSGVGDGMVYAGHVRHDRESEPVCYAIDAADGEERWRYDLEGGNGRLVHPPAVDDGVAYLAVSDSGVEAIDASDGSDLWRERLPAYGSPTVVDGSVFVGVDSGTDSSGVASLTADTGEQRWWREDGPDAVVPNGVAVADGTVYYATGESLVARDAVTGDLEWRIGGEHAGADGERFYRGVPAVAEDRLYATGSALFVIDRNDGDELDGYAFDDWTRGSPAVVDDAVYVSFAHGRLDALTACRTELLGRCLR